MNFTCPYCGRPTTITSPNYFENLTHISIAESTLGEVGFFIKSITCPNEKCSKLWLYTELSTVYLFYNEWRKKKVLKSWQLLPESEARVLPDYIPKPIQEDYYEACRIRDLSPKASATLARRCLQGMIRDFWGIAKNSLKDEINDLHEKINKDTWESIDAIRSVGNIGAHMEKDINIMLEVEPQEAQLLIGLIEQLIDDWYVERENRHKRTEALKQLTLDKKILKNKDVKDEEDVV